MELKAVDSLAPTHEAQLISYSRHPEDRSLILFFPFFVGWPPIVLLIWFKYLDLAIWGPGKCSVMAGSM